MLPLAALNLDVQFKSVVCTCFRTDQAAISPTCCVGDNRLRLRLRTHGPYHFDDSNERLSTPLNAIAAAHLT